MASDDACGDPLTILPVPIFGRRYDTLYVCANGLVSFQTTYTNPNPSADVQSYLGYSFLAPYYTDLDTSKNDTKGKVFYQLYDVLRDKRLMNHSNILNVHRILDEFEGEKQFRTTMAFVVTWYKISPYPADKRGDESVSFQLVLATDGTNTFVIYKYFPGEMTIQQNDVFIGYHFNTGEFKIHLTSFKLDALHIDKNIDTKGVVGLLSYRLTPFESSLANFDIQCLEWFESNKLHQLEYERKVNEMPKCPCNSRWIAFDPWFSASQLLAANAVNTSCTVVAPSSQFRPHGKVCCFDANTRQWLSYAPRAGGFLKFHPSIRRKEFESEDLRMKTICCEKSDYCHLYYDLRPVGECYSNFSYNFALSWGDPHIETLDSKQFTFNGWGEFILISIKTENTSFMLQGRTDKTRTAEGTLTDATIFTAFAARDNFNASIHVELNAERNGIYIYGNAIDYSLDFANLEKKFHSSTETLTLTRSDDTKALKVLFTSTGEPISLTISLGVEMLALGITLPPIFNNKTTGLFGNYDGDPSNDFVYPNGSILAGNATEREVFNYGISWSTQGSESVFFYPRGQRHADFEHKNFTPKFLDESTEEQRIGASLKCGNNTACVYDFIVTNNDRVAQSTKNVGENAQKEKEETSNEIPSIESNVTRTLYVTKNKPNKLKFYASDDGPVTFFFETNTVAAEFIYMDTKSAEANFTIYRDDQCELSVTARDKQGYLAPAIKFDLILCDGCNGHGTCVNDAYRLNNETCSLKKLECKCEPYWEGNSCQLDFDGSKGTPCSLNRTCSDVNATTHQKTGVAFLCSPCPDGYLKDGDKCLDIDECNSSSKMCSQICMNTNGSFLCKCERGYSLSVDHNTCEDIDECEEGKHNCDQICFNGVGNFTCGCHPGFEYNATMKTCRQTERLDICEKSSMNCCQTTGCSLLNGTAKCFCQNGFRLTDDGTKCEDVNECVYNPCSQSCSNFIGGFSCHCFQGYELVEDKHTCIDCKYPKYGDNCTETCQCGQHGLNCNHIKGCVCDNGWGGTNCSQDVDECVEDPDRCATPYEFCENSQGSFRCQCKAGFVKSDDRKCQDIDECSNPELNKCSQLCINGPGGFTCNCQRGYMLNPNNSHECIDVNECEIGTSGCEHICENVPGQFNCYCHHGYRLKTDRRTCIKEQDICAQLGNFTCSHICLVEDKKPKCDCATGYILNADERTCKDINECEGSINKCSQPRNCLNKNGSFSCLCDDGYWLENDGITCRDCDKFHFGRNCVKECNCGIGAAKCDTREGCICKPGWQGSQCDIDTNECNKTDNPCSGKNKICLNTAGSYRCLCNIGYIRESNTSVDCSDINECEDPIFNKSDQICNNTDGSFMCSCYKGFVLRGTRCIDIDECEKQNTCHHVCENLPGSYRCLCQIGFKVDMDNITQCKPRIECYKNETEFCGSRGAQCTRSSGIAKCQCTKGLQWNSETEHCIDIKDCDAKARCSHKCIEEIGGYSCECLDGFLLRDDNYTCTECYNNTYGRGCTRTCLCMVENAANQSQTCDHLNGTCICKPGWAGKCDLDIDECTLNTQRCRAIPNTGCHNTLGGYECSCLRGYILQNGLCVADNITASTNTPPLTDNYYPTIAIATSIPLGVLKISTIIVVICLMRKRQMKDQDAHKDVNRNPSMGSSLHMGKSLTGSVLTRSKSPSLGGGKINMHPGLTLPSKYSFEGLQCYISSDETGNFNDGNSWKDSCCTHQSISTVSY